MRRGLAQDPVGLAQLPYLTLQRLDPQLRLAARTWLLARVALGLAHPTPQRLRATADLVCDRFDRRSLRSMFAPVLQHHPHRSRRYRGGERRGGARGAFRSRESVRGKVGERTGQPFQGFPYSVRKWSASPLGTRASKGGRAREPCPDSLLFCELGRPARNTRERCRCEPSIDPSFVGVCRAGADRDGVVTSSHRASA